jgi:hypothetical protein
VRGFSSSWGTRCPLTSPPHAPPLPPAPAPPAAEWRHHGARGGTRPAVGAVGGRAAAAAAAISRGAWPLQQGALPTFGAGGRAGRGEAGRRWPARGGRPAARVAKTLFLGTMSVIEGAQSCGALRCLGPAPFVVTPMPPPPPAPCQELPTLMDEYQRPASSRQRARAGRPEEVRRRRAPAACPPPL